VSTALKFCTPGTVRYLFFTNWGEAVVEVVGGNDEEAEGDDNGVEEVVGVQDGILQRLACIRIS